MKIWFWILAALSIPISLFVTIICSMAKGLDLAGTIIGEIIFVFGIPAVVVGIACVVLGVIRLRKGNAKKAVMWALVTVVYSGIILAGYFIDDAAHSVLMDKDIAERNEQLYGENWDAAPNIEGIPELYQEVLNKFYAVVRDEWPAEELVDLSAMEMANYYGDASLDNIGFILMDVNGDGVDELMIGTTAPVQEGGTAIFCMYSDPENPFVNLHGEEEKIYHLHPGEGSTYVAEIGGTYVAENGSTDGVWLLKAEEGTNLVDITYQEVAMDPAGRLTLEMIPFSQYK